MNFSDCWYVYVAGVLSGLPTGYMGCLLTNKLLNNWDAHNEPA